MEHKDSIALLIGFTCILSGLFVSAIILMLVREKNRQQVFQGEIQRALLQNSFDAGEMQREIIFRNMHDQVNPMLRFVLRNMELHQQQLRRNDLHPEALEENIDMLLAALNDIRSCTHESVPVFINELGLLSALEGMVKRLTLPPGIKSTFMNISRYETFLPFDDHKQVNLYRISLAIIENIIQHSSCRYLDMIVYESGGQFVLEFMHDGVGINNDEVERHILRNKGTGLKSCKARALLLNAAIDYEETAVCYTVKVKIPVQ